MAADDDTLLTLIGEIHGALDLNELVDVLLRALPEAVPSDYISINDVGPDPDGVVAVILPEQPLHLHQAFARHAHEKPIAAHYAATHEGRPLRLSDVTTPEELRKTALYREVYADAAAVLGLSERTVQKHLERSYRALGVGSRSEASTIVWALVPAEPPAPAPRRVRLEDAS